jgi:hypothetical protein
MPANNKPEDELDTLVRQITFLLTGRYVSVNTKPVKEAIALLIAEQRAQAILELANELGRMQEVQGINGTWNYDPYMHGMYNGMEFCVSLTKGVEPKFREAPKQWLCDISPDIVDALGVHPLSDVTKAMKGDRHV